MNVKTVAGQGLVVLFALACTHARPTPTHEPPPIARTDDTIDHVFGIDVVDPYRWMETATGELDAWLRAQSALARFPDRGLAARAKQLAKGESAASQALLQHGRLLYTRRTILGTRDPSGTDRALVTPTPGTSIIDYKMSRDGTLVCYALSTRGHPYQSLHVLDIATGRPLPDVIEGVYGACQWLEDGRRFFYVSNTAEASRVHVLGQRPDEDMTILDHSATSPIMLAANENAWLSQVEHSPKAIATITDEHGEVRIAISPANPFDHTAPWQVVTKYGDGVVAGFVHADRLYLQTFKDAPNRKLVSVPLDNPELSHARSELAEDPNSVLGEVGWSADAAYYTRRTNRHTRLMRWTWSGAETVVPVPAKGWIADLTPDTAAQGVVFRVDSWVYPSAYYVYDPVAAKVSSVGLGEIVSAAANASDIVVDEVEVPNGGVTVSLTIVHQRSAALDGSHATILEAYGAYGYVEKPSFLGPRLAWIERGGVLAYAHVRGDGDKGTPWHDAGAREHKLDGVGDLITSADYLVAQHWTAPSRLGLDGGELGGILVGRAMTMRPELFAAVSIDAGMLDPARLANDVDFIRELGDPATETGFKGLYEMDPYQHVVPGTRYPAVLLFTGRDGGRVRPWHSAKFAARLLAASTSGRPIFVRAGSLDHLAWEIEMWTFMLSQFR